ncbi:MAG: hypothetical protein EPN21_06265 [Methylococcaceae bacterium]|nr:MAG: hypothetical protein EPN21_06265 [Methylococcaceae bacterium]
MAFRCWIVARPLSDAVIVGAAGIRCEDGSRFCRHERVFEVALTPALSGSLSDSAARRLSRGEREPEGARVVDIFDQAAERCEADTALAIARQLAQPALGVGEQRLNPDTGEVLCFECWEEIPVERLIAVPGANLCVSCLTVLEQQRRARRV